MFRRLVITFRTAAIVCLLWALLPAESLSAVKAAGANDAASVVHTLTAQDQVPVGKGLRVGRIVFASPVMLLPVKLLPAGFASTLPIVSGDFTVHAIDPPFSRVGRASHRCTLLQVFRC